MNQARHLAGVVGVVALFSAGCDGRLIAAGNLFVAAIPCAMLWLTINLKKTR